MNYILEKKSTFKGYDYYVIGLPMGHRCGYVVIPKNHPYHGKDYDTLDISCHGGLTYSDSHLVDLVEDSWVIGFDCAHLYDKKDTTIMSEEYKHPFLALGSGDVRTTEYVEHECKSIIHQLAKI